MNIPRHRIIVMVVAVSVGGCGLSPSPIHATHPQPVAVADSIPQAAKPENVDIVAITKRMDRFLDHYEEWQAPVRHYRAEYEPLIGYDGYTEEDFQHGLDELKTALKFEYDLDGGVYELLDPICTVYLTCNPQARDALRKLMADRETLHYLIWGYIYRMADRITRPGDISSLRKGLAAVSLEDGGFDYRDTIVSLSELFVRAEEAGIDPRPHFHAVADMSTDVRTSGGCDSLAKMMHGFESYAALRERRGRDKP